jgi:hypothetical protein
VVKKPAPPPERPVPVFRKVGDPPPEPEAETPPEQSFAALKPQGENAPANGDVDHGQWVTMAGFVDGKPGTKRVRMINGRIVEEA